jgi:hypothetical protein
MKGVIQGEGTAQTYLLRQGRFVITNPYRQQQVGLQRMRGIDQVYSFICFAEDSPSNNVTVYFAISTSNGPFPSRSGVSRLLQNLHSDDTHPSTGRISEFYGRSQPPKFSTSKALRSACRRASRTLLYVLSINFSDDTDCRLGGLPVILTCQNQFGSRVPPTFSMSKHWRKPRRMPVAKSTPTEHYKACIVSSLSLMVPIASYPCSLMNLVTVSSWDLGSG